MKVMEAMKEYKVRSFYDIVEALREHPEWLEEIRRMVLTDELLNLPRKFDKFVENEFKPLARRLDRLEQKFDNFVENEFKPLARRVDRLEQDMKVLKQDVAVLKQDVKVLKQDVGELKGDSFERKIKEKIASYLGRFLRRIRPIDNTRLADLLDEAVDGGVISEEDKDQVLCADGVVKGKSRKDASEAWILFEISTVVDGHDVERAVERAEILQKAVKGAVIPAVIGRSYAIPIEEVKSKGVIAVVVSS